LYNLLKEDYIRCVLPNVMLPLGKNGKYVEDYFKDNFQIDVKFLEETRTIPGHGLKSGRMDQIFDLHVDSVGAFDKIKGKIKAEYAKDIVKKGDHKVYNESVYLRYFQRAERQLLASGEITEAEKYMTKEEKFAKMRAERKTH